MLRSLAAAGAACLLVALASCSSTTQPPAPDAGAGAVTFHEHVEPVLQARCQGCHAEGGVAPFALTTYAQTAAMAQAIVSATEKRTMPPWGARTTSECAPRAAFLHDPSLSDAELATLRTWRDQGTPEGDPAKAPPPKGKPTVGLANPSAVLAPAGPFTVSGAKDVFRCFVLDPKLADVGWVGALAIVPGDPRVVSHVLVFADPKAESATKTLDAAGSYECFGGSGVAQQSLVAAWAPGGPPMEYPAGIATPLAPGSRLVMQVHYHPQPTVQNVADTTKVQLRFEAQAPEWVATPRLIGNFPSEGYLTSPTDGLVRQPNETTAEFRIPANAKGHVEEMRLTIPPIGMTGAPITELLVQTVAGHMHYAGRDIRLSVERASPTPEQPKDECLLQIPAWDFGWQLGYSFATEQAKLPRLVPGDVLKIRCTYDNTMDNPFLRKALSEQNLSAPVDVGLGESTLEEMCLGMFVFVSKRP